MAGKGTYGAYRQLNPIQADFGDPMERYAQRMMQIQDKDLAFKEARRKENQAIFDKFGEDMSSLEQVITGVGSIDDVNYNYFSETQRELGDMYRALQNDPRLARDPNFMRRKSQLLNSPKILQAFQKRITDRITTITEAVSNGTASKAMEAELDELKSYYGGKNLDKDGNWDGTYSPQFTLKNDRNGNMYALVRTPNGLKPRNVSAVLNGYEYGEMINKVDPLELVEGFKKSLGPQDEVRRMGGGAGIVDEWNDKKEQTANEYFGNLLNEEGGPSAIAKSLWMDHMGNDSLEGINLGDIQKYIVDRAAVSYGKDIKSWSRDPQPKATSRKDPAYLRSQVTAMLDQNNKLVVNDQGQIGFTTPPVKVPIGSQGEGIVNSVYYDPGTNTVSAFISQELSGLDETLAGIEGIQRAMVSVDDPAYLSIIAKNMGFRDLKDLTNYLKYVTPQAEGTTPSSEGTFPGASGSWDETPTQTKGSSGSTYKVKDSIQ